MSRIGVCVICFDAHKSDPERIALGTTGFWLTNTGAEPSKWIPRVCEACDGKGYVYFRSDK